MNRSCNAVGPLDFKKADWPGLCSSMKLVNWQVKLHDCIASVVYLGFLNIHILCAGGD